MLIPEEVESYFAYQRAKQLEHVNIAHAKKNVRETKTLLDSAMAKVMERGVQMDEVAQTSEQVMHSSDEFFLTTRKAASCVPDWWWIPRCVWERKQLPWGSVCK